MSAGSIASSNHIKRELVGFTMHVRGRISNAGMEVSAAKSVCTAFSAHLCNDIAQLLGEFNISFMPMAKSFGVGLGAGARRNASVINKRLKKFQNRYD